MPRAYTLDLRRKVIEAVVLNGMRQCEIAEAFNLNRTKISDWLQCSAATGVVQSIAYNHHGHRHKNTDWDAFRVFIEANPDKTQTEKTELWLDAISDRTISRA